MRLVKPALVALLFLPLVATLGPGACFPRVEFPGYGVIRLLPGGDIEFQVRAALQTAKPGTIIEFPAGNFAFTDELVVATSHIVLRGRGPLATTLDFSGQQTGAQGILAVKDGFAVQGLRVLNSKGDGIRVESSDGVLFQDVR